MKLSKLFALSLLTCSIALTGCSNNQEQSSSPSETERVEAELYYTDMMSGYRYLTSNDKFVEIDYETIKTYFDNPDATEVVFIGSPNCPHCQDAIVNVQKEAIEADVNVNYLCIDDFTDEQTNELKTYLDPILHQSEYGKDIYLPHLFAIKEGSISQNYSEIGYTEGRTDYSSIFEAVTEK